MIRKFLEYIDQKSFDPISSFIVKDELNSKIWDDFKMKENIREDSSMGATISTCRDR